MSSEGDPLIYTLIQKHTIMYLATFCELADKLMWWFIFSQKVRKVSESQELCTAYTFHSFSIFFFCWELYSL